MSTFFASCRVLFFFAAIAVSASTASADPPDRLFKYRFIPSKSTVNVTGGFAGFDTTLNIRGQFGLVMGYHYEPTPTANAASIAPFAKFVDVKAILFNPLSLAPSPVPGWDLDDTLNLSGLKGVPGWNAPSNIFFRGEDGQGQPMKLFAIQRGPLLYMLGENDPGCCDFFKYEVKALAHIAPYADFNLDGRIDRLDVNRLTSNFGIAAGATFEQGDADGDGDIDGDDLIVWQTGLGPGIDVNAMALAAGAQFAVPEPTSAALAILCVSALAATLPRRRRNSRR